MRAGDRQRHAAHARLQVHVHRAADRRHRGLSQDRAAASRRGAGRRPSAKGATPIDRSTIGNSQQGESHDTRRCEARGPDGRAGCDDDAGAGARGRRHPVRHDRRAGRRQDGRRDGLGQGRRLDHHHHGLHRRERQLLFPADAGRALSRVGAGDRVRHREGAGRSRGQQGAELHAQPAQGLFPPAAGRRDHRCVCRRRPTTTRR